MMAMLLRAAKLPSSDGSLCNLRSEAGLLRKPFLHFGILIFSLLVLTGCGEETPPPATDTPPQQTNTKPAPIQRTLDFAAIARGAELYAQYCAACHGAQAEGAPNWQELGPDGKVRPPPLNGTGHTWHHPLAGLRHVIKNGGPPGSNMPAFKDQLTDRQINDIIIWFQFLWPDEVYQAWYKRDQSFRAKKAGE